MKLLKEAGAEEESLNIPRTTHICYVRAVVELLSRGPKLLVAPLWVNVKQPQCASADSSHICIVQKTKGYLSLEALLWYISKCQFHNLAGERKKNHPPLASPLFLYLLLPHRDTTKNPSRHKTSHEPFNAWQLTQGALLKIPSLLYQHVVEEWHLVFSHYIDKYEWKEQTDGRGEWVNTLALNAFNQY